MNFGSFECSCNLCYLCLAYLDGFYFILMSCIVSLNVFLGRWWKCWAHECMTRGSEFYFWLIFGNSCRRGPFLLPSIGQGAKTNFLDTPTRIAQLIRLLRVESAYLGLWPMTLLGTILRVIFLEIFRILNRHNSFNGRWCIHRQHGTYSNFLNFKNICRLSL